MKTSSCISIDSMSGDRGPSVIMEGLAQFAKQEKGVRFLLHGDESVLKPLLQTYGHKLVERCEIRHTDKLIAMDQKPAQALRSGQDSSMWNAIKSVSDNEASSVVSAGNTGALMAISKMILRTIEGLNRPALAASWPTRDGVVAMLDAGADITANALQLAEFSVLGEAFAQAVHHKPRPRIGILNIGSEDMKGFESLREAGAILENSDINYTGFIEASRISSGDVDVVVTDGFTGNACVKCAEGTVQLVSDKLREALHSSWRSKIGALLARSAFRQMRGFLDPDKYNGAVFAGLRGVSVKSHGNANSLGIARALHVAHNMAERGGFDEKISDRLKTLTALPSEESEEKEAAL